MAAKVVSDLTMILGTALKYTGGAALLVMAVIGTLSIDIVLLLYILKRTEKGDNTFLTFLLWNNFFSSPRCHHSHGSSNSDDYPILLLVSPITSLIAVGLAIGLGMPHVGLAILGGWVIAASIYLLGKGLEALAEYIAPGPEVAASVKAPQSGVAQMGIFPSAPPPPYDAGAPPAYGAYAPPAYGAYAPSFGHA